MRVTGSTAVLRRKGKATERGQGVVVRVDPGDEKEAGVGAGVVEVILVNAVEGTGDHPVEVADQGRIHAAEAVVIIGVTGMMKGEGGIIVAVGKERRGMMQEDETLYD